MKTTLIAVLVAALASVAFANSDCEEALDRALFEQWLCRIHELAPRYDLKLDGNEGEEEFFYLYCWQSKDHSLVHAIQKAKQAWENEK